MSLEGRAAKNTVMLQLTEVNVDLRVCTVYDYTCWVNSSTASRSKSWNSFCNWVILQTTRIEFCAPIGGMQQHTWSFGQSPKTALSSSQGPSLPSISARRSQTNFPKDISESWGCHIAFALLKSKLDPAEVQRSQQPTKVRIFLWKINKRIYFWNENDLKKYYGWY